MKKITTLIVEQAKNFVLDILENQLSEKCVFHSADHTLDVYNNSLIIGRESGLSADDLNCLAISAIFHDVGYVKVNKGHEKVSADFARSFLSAIQVENCYIEQVEKAILATKIPQLPKDSISKALCDADLMHLTYPEYFENIKKMRLEWQLTGRAHLSEKEFHQQSIVFFTLHKYHTKYGQEVLAPKKQLTLDRIKAKLYG